LDTRKILFLLSVVVAGLGVLSQQHVEPTEKPGVAILAQPNVESSSAIDKAFAQRAYNVQVEGKGVVVKVLRDDDEGSRHQKFLLRVPSGLTILVAHNIDLAPRLEGLQAGDTVAFYGDYEWNEKGGVVHWTHRDPAGRHAAGWLKHDGQTVQ